MRICEPPGVTVAYLAAEGYEEQLARELGRRGRRGLRRHGRLFIDEAASGIEVERRPPAWAANVWLDAEHLEVRSIRDLADQLRARQRNWAAYLPEHRGRGGLVHERLPHVSARPLELGAPAPNAPLGSWTLLTPTVALAAARCTSPFPNGEVRFVEDRTGPPSRAYLKLWEACTRLGRTPGPGDRCVDLGASPGGWTWTLARLGATVLAVDKAPLDPQVDASANVHWQEGSAFALEPRTAGRVDWLCSDVIAYPDRLLTLVTRWITEGDVGTMVVTIKFQGETDHDAAEAFAAIAGARVVHLHHNKHELTFLWERAASTAPA